jgi:uncharacterized protein with von Willebrand factor type A (vWA) domain
METAQPDLILATTRFIHFLEEAGLPTGSDEYRLFLPALMSAWTGEAADPLPPGLLPPDVDAAAVEQALAFSRLVGQVTRLFDQLRRAADLPLGIDGYMLMLQALQKGHGRSTPTNPDALKRLCRIVWANSPTEQAIIDAHFDQLVTIQLPADQPADVSAPEGPTAPPPESQTDQTAVRPTTTEPSPPPLQSQPGQRPKPQPSLPASSTLTPGDLVIEAAPLLLSQTEDREVALQQYLLVNEYLPVTRRQMKQSWRYLRRPRREGPPVEVDVAATIHQISQDGFFLTPVLRPRRVNKAGLLLLIDQEGSMAPFHVLARRLRETAVDAGKLGRADTYYFHDCPPPPKDAPRPTAANPYREHLLYRREQLRDVRPISDIIGDFQGLETGALIFSDAGAARGGWDEARIEHTGLFLYQLKSVGVEHIAWVNPMPEERWAHTSAEAIARLLPMFSMDRQGLYQAIDVLRGRAARAFTL